MARAARSKAWLGALAASTAAAWRRLVDEAADAVYPRLCWLCGEEAEDGWACAEHALVLGLSGARCKRCAARLGEGLPDRATCACCRRDSPGFARLLAVGSYREGGALAEWVLAFKHGGRRDLARPLGALLASRVAAEPDARVPGAWIVPVPLHPLRQIERGYDQADRLARALAEGLGLERQRALVRTRWTPPQGGLLSPPRAANVRAAFALRRAFRRARIHTARSLEGRSVLLVDDVCASGATLSECARVLVRAGAARVLACVLARAGDDAGNPY